MAYTSEQIKFLKENSVLSDTELTARFTEIFGVNVAKAAIRKKRQRLGLIKSAEAVRAEWTAMMGLSRKEIMDLLEDTPPVDIYAEQKRLSAARQLR